MKYVYIALIIIFPCIAMEKETIEHPTAVAFIDSNRVVVGGENGCAVFNSHSKQLIKKLTQNTVTSLVANKDIIAFIGRKKLQIKLTVFDAITHKKKWGTDTYHSQLSLNSAHQTIVSSQAYDTNIYNYKEQTAENTRLNFFTNTSPYSTTTCHPTQNSLIYSTGHSLCIAHPLKKQYYNTQQEFCPLQDIGIHHNIRAVEGTACSPDGNKILFKYNMVRRNHASYFIYDLTDTKKIAHYILDSQQYSAFAFHPTISLLAALSCDNKIKFWDYAAHKLIAITDPLSGIIDEKKTEKTFTQQLSFSPDGSQLAVALPDAWHILQTPHIHDKNNALIIYALRTRIPEDIVQLIITNMAERSSLSYINVVGLMNLTPLIIPPISEPDLTQETQRKSIQHWVEFKDPNGEESEDSLF